LGGTSTKGSSATDPQTAAIYRSRNEIAEAFKEEFLTPRLPVMMRGQILSSNKKSGIEHFLPIENMSCC